MAYTSDADSLTSVRNAIDAIVTRGAKSYTVALPGGGSRSFQALELSELREIESSLLARVNRSTRGPFGVAVMRDIPGGCA